MTTLIELKDQMLTEVNQIEGYINAFDDEFVEAAYTEATRECGFSFPEVGDEDGETKILWLNRRMRRYVLMQLWQRNINAIKAGDSEAQVLPMNYKGIVAYMDQEFMKAREENPVLSDASVEMPLMVYGTGLVDDRIGQTILTSEKRT